MGFAIKQVLWGEQVKQAALELVLPPKESGYQETHDERYHKGNAEHAHNLPP